MNSKLTNNLHYKVHSFVSFRSTKMLRSSSRAKIVQLFALIQFVGLSFGLFFLKTVFFGTGGGASRSGMSHFYYRLGGPFK